VDQKNRKEDRFQCLHCGHVDLSDRVAALNYARRFGDPEIGQYFSGQSPLFILGYRRDEIERF
jgi:transposase